MIVTVPMSKKLTYKQKAFVNEFVKTKNATASAMNVYDVKSRTVAKSIGTENLSKPAIRQSIEVLLQASGYDPVSSVEALIENQEKGKGVKATASDSIRASELLLKMSGNFIEKSQTVSVNYGFDRLNRQELLRLKVQFDEFIDEV